MKYAENLYKTYKTAGALNEVQKSNENMFVLGAGAVLARSTELLHEFFNHKSDANKYLTAEQQEDLEKDFGNWCVNNKL
jgi:hypothetical protein